MEYLAHHSSQHSLGMNLAIVVTLFALALMAVFLLTGRKNER